MSWASRKRTTYLTLLCIIVISGVGLSWYVFVYEEPRCDDGVLNGSEDGVDCGGVCEKICPFEAVSPIVRWTRFFEAGDGVYNVVAYIENPNLGAEALRVPYTVKLRDKDNVLIYERKGVADIPLQQIVPIFEATLVTGDRVPQRAFFEFNGEIDWKRIGEGAQGIDLRSREVELTERNGLPLVTGVLENRGDEFLENVEVIVLLYAEDGNAIGASKTVIERIGPDETRNLVYTWPKKFLTDVAKIVIVPKVSSYGAR